MSNKEIQIDEKDPSVLHIKKFVKLFKQRDETYSSITEELFEFINHNVIASFDEITQLPPGCIKWLDLQLDLDETYGSLIVSFTLDYTKEIANKFVLDNFGYDLDEQQIRLVKFGIPLHLIFSSKEDVTNFILDVTSSSTEDIDIKADTSQNFDISTLTPDQLNQLQLFNKQGSTH